MRLFILATFILLLSFSCKKEKQGVVFNMNLEGTTRFCYTGDTGTGGSEQQMVAHALAKENCDYIVVLGDVIYPDGVESVDDPQFYEKFEKPYSEILQNSPTKFIWAAGNHDYRGSLDALKKYAAKKENVIFPKLYFQIRFEDKLCLSILDTNFNYRYQQDFFENKIDTCSYNVAAAHHPYRSSGEHGDAILFIEKALKRDVIGKVDMFFSGHDHHLSDEGSFHGTRQLISGAGGKLRGLEKEPPIWGESHYGYAVVDFTKKDLTSHVQFIGVDKKGTKVLHEFHTRKSL